MWKPYDFRVCQLNGPAERAAYASLHSDEAWVYTETIYSFIAKFEFFRFIFVNCLKHTGNWKLCKPNEQKLISKL